jgi:hypothetical protein
MFETGLTRGAACSSPTVASESQSALKSTDSAWVLRALGTLEAGAARAAFRARSCFETLEAIVATEEWSWTFSFFRAPAVAWSPEMPSWRRHRQAALLWWAAFR